MFSHQSQILSNNSSPNLMSPQTSEVSDVSTLPHGAENEQEPLPTTLDSFNNNAKAAADGEDDDDEAVPPPVLSKMTRPANQLYSLATLSKLKMLSMKQDLVLHQAQVRAYHDRLGQPSPLAQGSETGESSREQARGSSASSRNLQSEHIDSQAATSRDNQSHTVNQSAFSEASIGLSLETDDLSHSSSVKSGPMNVHQSGPMTVSQSGPMTVSQPALYLASSQAPVKSSKTVHKHSNYPNAKERGSSIPPGTAVNAAKAFLAEHRQPSTHDSSTDPSIGARVASPSLSTSLISSVKSILPHGIAQISTAATSFAQTDIPSTIHSLHQKSMLQPMSFSRNSSPLRTAPSLSTSSYSGVSGPTHVEGKRNYQKVN